MMPHNHKAILQKVRQELPADELLCDLADLFKIFGDTTRIKILYALLESEIREQPANYLWTHRRFA